jgi:uncharacterized protein (DUF433 family)
MTMARLDPWLEDVGTIRKELGIGKPALRLEPGRIYSGLIPGKFLMRWKDVSLARSDAGEDPLMDRIVIDSAVLQGKPILRGFRISVEQVLGWLASGSTVEEILGEFPELERQDVLAALEYARRLVAGERFYPAIKPA